MVFINNIRFRLIKRLIGKIKPMGYDFEIRTLTPEEEIAADVIAKCCAGRCEAGTIIKKLYGDYMAKKYISQIKKG